ncbi:hypothetical protein RCL1_003772 [Eukaryota sp. TZLM3-RCL]
MPGNRVCSIFSPSRFAVKKSDLEKQLSDQSLLKTELCRSWVEQGYCQFGPSCHFAHDVKELRPKLAHPKLKTVNCTGFHRHPYICLYGNRCRFVHNETPLRNSTRSPLHHKSDHSRAVLLNGSCDLKPIIIILPQDDDVYHSASSSRRLPVFQHLTDIEVN